MSVRLETPRLRLREITPADADFLLELMNEPGYLENIGDRGVRTLDDAARYIAERFLSSYAVEGWGLWCVERRGEGERLGVCGLVRRDGLEHPDIGFAFLARHGGQGFAIESAQAVLGFARDTLALPRLLGLVAPWNERSMRLLEKLGLREIGRLRLPGATRDSLLWATDLRRAD